MAQHDATARACRTGQGHSAQALGVGRIPRIVQNLMKTLIELALGCVIELKERVRVAGTAPKERV